MTQAVRYHLFAHYPSDFFTGNIVDCGDYVIVTNSRKVKVTGKKEQQVLFRKHSMFPGGLKETPYKDMKKKHPEEVRFMSYSSYVL
jgi:ribosomal protein L13